MARKSKYIPGRFELRVRSSATGKGLFAQVRIPKGACIVEYVGRAASLEEMTRDEGKYLFWISKLQMINGNVPENIARYINHSCAPNCEADGPSGRVFILATKNIQAGEELTYDYGKEYFDKHIRPKGCLCTKCTRARSRDTLAGMGQKRISPIQPKKSKSRKTKKRLAVKATMLAARAARKGKKSSKRR